MRTSEGAGAGLSFVSKDFDALTIHALYAVLPLRDDGLVGSEVNRLDNIRVAMLGVKSLSHSWKEHC
jgi:hypothetical protein